MQHTTHTHGYIVKMPGILSIILCFMRVLKLNYVNANSDMSTFQIE